MNMMNIDFESLYKDTKFQLIVFVFLILLAGITVYATHSGLLLITALLIFGGASLFSKQPNIKISSMIALVLLALANIGINGLKFGIDFSGGTRIPIILERTVDEQTMGELVQTIKTRVNVLGLTEVKVREVGGTQIYVEMPTSGENTIRFIEQTLSHQGVYQGIVDGKVAVKGDNIFPPSIQEASQGQRNPGEDWAVVFSVDREGADMFALAAKGKLGYPIYMFLDRPEDAIIVYDNQTFKSFIQSDSGEKETYKTMMRALALETGNLSVLVVPDISDSESESVTNSNSVTNANITPITPATNKTRAFVMKSLANKTKAALKERGFRVVELEDSKMTPEFQRTRAQELILNKLEVAGLLTAPILGGDVTSGIPNYNYKISGPVAGTNPRQKALLAQQEVKSIQSILKGGSLPVQISLGSRTSLPASLGSEFLKLSLIGVVASLIIISVLIGIRYRNLSATLPIVLISSAELVILVSILGSFTIDLAAMAGIIAAIGVGVDAQIVITDELLKKEKKDEEHTTAEKVGLAFGIIKTNALVAIFAMIPLLFSGLVEVIGFATSTILGALLGYMLTRPTYAAIVEKVIVAVETKEQRS